MDCLPAHGHEKLIWKLFLCVIAAVYGVMILSFSIVSIFCFIYFVCTFFVLCYYVRIVIH
jgi:hypothetical protein